MLVGFQGAIAVINPGAGDPRRRWPPEKFAAVADALAASGLRVVLTGSRDDVEITGRVARHMQAERLDLAGRVSLGGLAGVLARASVMVSNDSGPLHLALAVGTRTVGIFWCGNLLTYGPLTRSRHRPVMSWRLACPICGLDCTEHDCEHDASFVAGVPVSEVLDSAFSLLASSGIKPRSNSVGV